MKPRKVILLRKERRVANDNKKALDRAKARRDDLVSSALGALMVLWPFILAVVFWSAQWAAGGVVWFLFLMCVSALREK